MKPLLFQYYGNYSIDPVLRGKSLSLFSNERVFYRIGNEWHYQKLDKDDRYLPDLSGQGIGLIIQKIDDKKACCVVNQQTYEILMDSTLDLSYLDFFRFNGNAFIIFRKIIHNFEHKGHPAQLCMWELKSDGSIIEYRMPSPIFTYHILFSQGGLIFWSIDEEESKQFCYYLSLQNPIKLLHIPVLPFYDRLPATWEMNLQYQQKVFSVPIEFRKLGIIDNKVIAQVVVKCMKCDSLLPYIPLEEHKKQDFGKFKVLFSYPEHDFKTYMYINEKQAAEKYLLSPSFEKMINHSLNLYLSGALAQQFFIELEY